VIADFCLDVLFMLMSLPSLILPDISPPPIANGVGMLAKYLAFLNFYFPVDLMAVGGAFWATYYASKFLVRLWMLVKW
jgi:hypothetical protein